MSARFHQKQTELYAWDLIWAVAQSRYQNDIPMPSDLWKDNVKVDRRSADQIIDDLIKKCNGR